LSQTALKGVRNPFRALVATFVPEAADLSPAEWRDGEALAEGLLAARPAAVRRQVRMLVRAVDILALLRGGRRLARLDPTARIRLLESLQDSPSLLLRRGIWGLRTLAFLVYYGRPEGRAAVGYRASPTGWEARQPTEGDSATRHAT
jgi:hypothetical protein